MSITVGGRVLFFLPEIEAVCNPQKGRGYWLDKIILDGPACRIPRCQVYHHHGMIVPRHTANALVWYDPDGSRFRWFCWQHLPDRYQDVMDEDHWERIYDQVTVFEEVEQAWDRPRPFYDGGTIRT